jgi:hypothetical protein
MLISRGESPLETKMKVVFGLVCFWVNQGEDHLFLISSPLKLTK